jgi:hypothetical protein
MLISQSIWQVGQRRACAAAFNTVLSAHVHTRMEPATEHLGVYCAAAVCSIMCVSTSD